MDRRLAIIAKYSCRVLILARVWAELISVRYRGVDRPGGLGRGLRRMGKHGSGDHDALLAGGVGEERFTFNSAMVECNVLVNSFIIMSFSAII